MMPYRRFPMLRNTVLPKIASLIRQLSLFDKEAATEPTPKQSKPASPNHSKHASNPTMPTEYKANDFQILCTGPYAHIEVCLKPKLWDSWRAAWTPRKETLRLEIPEIFSNAPLPVKQSLLQWAVLVSRRDTKKKPELKAERRRLETDIRAYLLTPTEAIGPKLHARKVARNQRKLSRLTPQGRHHDLSASFQRVNTTYFENALQARPTWSARLGGLSTHSLAQDANGQTYHLITISRGYDSADVTADILDGVMYHECLHAAIPPITRNGRRVVHGPEFKKRERAYAHFEVWRNWHRDGLPKSLRRMRRTGY